MYRIAMLSIHSCPLASPGGKETGGMNVYVRELCRELAKKGLHIDIFTRSQNPSIPQIVTFHKGVRIIHLKAGPEAPYDKNLVWFHLPEFLEGIEQFCREEKVSYQLIHSHYWLSGWIGTTLSKRWNIPLLHMFHTLGYLKNKSTALLGERESPVRLEIETQLMKCADHLVAASHREKIQMILTYGALPEKISVIPCGVDTNLFTPHYAREAKLYPDLPPKRFILFVGRIDPVKGIDTLLKAMAIVKNKLTHSQEVHLLIIGGNIDHPVTLHDCEMHKLKRLATRLGLNHRVIFLGAQRQDQLPYFYSAAEVCVLPSRYESFGMVALEAMSCGTPVIASQVGGLTSLIHNGINGFLVPESDEQSLAEKLLLVLTHPSLKESLGREAQRRAQEFCWYTIAHRIMALYRSLLEERSLPKRCMNFSISLFEKSSPPLSSQ